MTRRIKGVAIAAAFLIAAIAYGAPALSNQNSKTDSPEAVGARLFKRECADCHGEDGRGRMLKQPDFTSSSWNSSVSDEKIFKSIKWGKEPMPFYAGALTDNEINSLVSYIRSLPGKANKPDAASSMAQAESKCVTCHKKESAAMLTIFQHSTHARQGISCDNCHGGQPLADEKQKAHAGNFKPGNSVNEKLEMCGACHAAQLGMFKTSKHFIESKGAARLDCVQCHGAHTVGSPARAFSFALFCAGCHGLEYLPALPGEFQKMLALTDDLNDSINSMRSAGKTPTEDVMKRREEIRKLVSEIVHPTDLNGGLKKIPNILELGQSLKQKINK